MKKKLDVREKAELLRNWREFLGLTQKELAEKVGRKMRSIGHWEAGNFNYKAVWVAGKLGLTEAEFLAGPSAYLPKTEQPESIAKENKESIPIPSLLVRLYMLSEIRKSSIQFSPIEGFTAPTITVDNTNEIIVVRVDQPSGINAKRVHVMLHPSAPPAADDIVLVWDGKKNRADFVLQEKMKPHHFFLGLVVFFI